jgi:hypothetical protein
VDELGRPIEVVAREQQLRSIIRWPSHVEVASDFGYRDALKGDSCGWPPIQARYEHGI